MTLLISYELKVKQMLNTFLTEAHVFFQKLQKLQTALMYLNVIFYPSKSNAC